MSFRPQEGEKILLREDCAEDRLKTGVLILTNKRILFQRTEGRVATFSKKEGEVILDIPLQAISAFRAEGFLVKKFVIVAVDQTYKFGVFSNGKWEKEMRQAKGTA
ncbi:MAG TPA: PH domain-containing protein [Nitrososphaera sp.]|nr:PH domain-containing protein [Nitrososphaera sp.]